MQSYATINYKTSWLNSQKKVPEFKSFGSFKVCQKVDTARISDPRKYEMAKSQMKPEKKQIWLNKYQNFQKETHPWIQQEFRSLNRVSKEATLCNKYESARVSIERLDNLSHFTSEIKKNSFKNQKKSVGNRFKNFNKIYKRGSKMKKNDKYKTGFAK